jgi:uncharacterized membrane protein
MARAFRLTWSPRQRNDPARFHVGAGGLVLMQRFLAILAPVALAAACATVQVRAPDKPIEINLNVKIDQQIRVKLDKDVEDLIKDNPDIF